MTGNGERGQAMILIALAFIGLIAFIGLAIDAGILFAHLGHLRRAVDAAALSAANQIRQTTTINDITGSAEQLILLNLPAVNADDLDVVVETCTTPGTSIPNCTVGTYDRKLARVQATLDVNLAFMPIVGFNSVALTADAISEAASIDLVLVIDNSTSMAYDAACDDGDDDDDWAEENLPGGSGAADGVADDCDPPFGTGRVGSFEDKHFRDPDNCNPWAKCEPFESVRSAAKVLVQKMYTGYDRIALVTFNRYAGRISPAGSEGTDLEEPLHEANLHFTTDKNVATQNLDDMRVYPIVDVNICDGWGGDPQDPRKCMVTNTAAALMVAAIEIEDYGREEALKVVVLLSDGLANAAYWTGSFAAPGHPLDQLTDWICPEEYWVPRDDGYDGPTCSDGNPDVGYNGHSNITRYDTDDWARSMADYLGCMPGPQEACLAGGGLGSVIFTIGLGRDVAHLSGNYPSEVVGEELLRYIARVGYNGDPELTSQDGCFGAASATSCGNYYYAPEADDLDAIFSEIADRIFTRLTH